MLLPLAFSSKSRTSQAPRKSVAAGGDEHAEQAVVLEHGLHPQLALVHEEAHLLDADEVPALERRHHHRRRFDPSPLQVAATVGRDHQAHEVLHQQDRPEHEEGADEEDGRRAVDVGRDDDHADDQPRDAEHRHRILRDLFDAVDEIVATAGGLGPGDPLAPALLLAGLLLEALLFQPLEAMDALDRRRLLLRRAAARISAHSGGIAHDQTKLDRGASFVGHSSGLIGPAAGSPTSHPGSHTDRSNRW